MLSSIVCSAQKEINKYNDSIMVELLDKDGLSFRISFDYAFEFRDIETCTIKEATGFNELMIKPEIRYVLRQTSSRLFQNEVRNINIEIIKNTINNNLDKPFKHGKQEKVRCNIELTHFEIKRW